MIEFWCAGVALSCFSCSELRIFHVCYLYLSLYQANELQANTYGMYMTIVTNEDGYLYSGGTFIPYFTPSLLLPLQKKLFLFKYCQREGKNRPEKRKYAHRPKIVLKGCI